MGTLEFALAARVMFDAHKRPVELNGARAPRFAEWRTEAGPSGPTEADWLTHLGTLFPDVRPRRWMEMRVIDELSDRAIRRGMGDSSLRELAADAFGIAEAAMDRFPTGWFGRTACEATAAFRERYVETGRTRPTTPGRPARSCD